jgi:hypothetical protein
VSQLVTIVIPHFNAEILCDCLESVFAHSDLPVRVIVIDDHPDAPSIQRARREFPQIEILRNERNLGFSGSCNRGLDAARTPYAVLLNDDTRVAPNWLSPLVETAERDPRIAACQPKLLSATTPDTFDYGGGAGGYMDRLGYTFCRGRLFDHLERDSGQYDRSVYLFWACGSALFLRLEAARRLDFLDLDYFMHHEEIDLCWRLQLSGHCIVAVPSSVIYHHSGFTLPPDTFRKNYLNHRNSLVMAFKNMALHHLLWIWPLRLALDLVASLTFLLNRQWHKVLAPIAAILWCLTHPHNLWRRRRHSQSHRSVHPASLHLGIYAGSAVFQYFMRRVRTSSQLMREETAA